MEISGTTQSRLKARRHKADSAAPTPPTLGPTLTWQRPGTALHAAHATVHVDPRYRRRTVWRTKTLWAWPWLWTGTNRTGEWWLQDQGGGFYTHREWECRTKVKDSSPMIIWTKYSKNISCFRFHMYLRSEPKKPACGFSCVAKEWSLRQQMRSSFIQFYFS